jgi:tetratricopeptide (TPR) repeat protein
MPNNLDARETRGFIHLKLGDIETALAEYGASLKLDPNRPLALYGRGLARIKRGDREGGEADRAAARALYAGIDREFTGYGMN